MGLVFESAEAAPSTAASPNTSGGGVVFEPPEAEPEKSPGLIDRAMTFARGLVEPRRGLMEPSSPEEPLTPSERAKLQMDVDLARERRARNLPGAYVSATPQNATDLAVQYVRDRTGSEAIATGVRRGIDISGALVKTVPQTLQLGSDISQLLTGGFIGKDASAALQEAVNEISRGQSAEEQAHAARLNAMLADPDVTPNQITGFLTQHPDFMVNTALPSIGSMLVGAGGGLVGRGLAAGRATRLGLEGAERAGALTAGAERGSIYSNILMNAGDTFNQTDSPNTSDKYKAAAIAALGTLVAGKATGGGAEAQLASGGRRGFGAAIEANPLARAAASTLTTGGKEYLQEGGEQLAQTIGQQVGETGRVDLAAAAKEASVAAAAGALTGGPAGLAMSGRRVITGTKEASEVGHDAARVAKAAGKKSKIDLTQLSSTTNEETGETTFHTPSGVNITKDQWDNAGRRVREAWLQPAEGEVPSAKSDVQMRPAREAKWAEKLPGLPRGFYEALSVVPSADVGAAQEGQLQELRRRVQEEGQAPITALREMLGTEFADAPRGLRQALERAVDLQGVSSRAAQGEGRAGRAAPPVDEELVAAPPPKSERIQELERLASEAETPEARQTLERQAATQAKKEETEFNKHAQADDLMRLAAKTKDEEIAADLRAQALKLHGVEEKAEPEKPAKAGLRAREETVEHVEAKPVEEPTTAEINKRAAAVAEEAKVEPAGPSRVVETKPEPAALTKTRSESPILKALQKFGGIKESEMSDMGIAKTTGKTRKEQFVTKGGKRVTREVAVRDDFRVGKDSLFRKDGKLGIDNAAEWLQQHGYLADQADHERAREIIRKELAEPGSMKKIAVAEEDMIARAQQQREDEANAATIKEARDIGIETEGRPVAEVERALVQALENDWTKKTGQPLDSIEHASIARRASDINEQATHDAAVRHGDDEAAFIRAAQEIIDAHEKRSTAGKREVAEPAPDTTGRRAAAGEGKPQAAEAKPSREATVRGEQRLRVTERGVGAEAGRGPAGAGRNAPTGDLASNVRSLREAMVRRDYRKATDAVIRKEIAGTVKEVGRRAAEFTPAERAVLAKEMRSLTDPAADHFAHIGAIDDVLDAADKRRSAPAANDAALRLLESAPAKPAPTRGVATGPLLQAQTNFRARFKSPEMTLTPADPGDRRALGRNQAIQNTVAEGIVRDLAKAVGLDVKVAWYEQSGGPGISGFSPDYARDTIFMNVRGKSPAVNTVGHEFLHWLKKNHPDDYRYFAKAVLPALRNLPEHRRALNEKYEKHGAPGLDVETAFEELLADVWGDVISDPKFYTELAKQNPTAFRSFAEKILQFFDRLFATITSKDVRTQQFLTEMRAARKAVADTLSQMQKRGAVERELTESVQRAQESLSVARVTEEDLKAAGADANKMAAHKEAVDAKVKEFLGEKAYTWMESNGLLRPTWSWEDTSPLARDRDVPAYTGVREGQARVVLYYDRITDLNHVPALLMHEIGTHFGMRRMLGEEGFKNVLEQVRALKERKDAVFAEAWSRVKRDYVDEQGKPFFPEGSDAFVEEVAAAVVESQPKDSFVRRLIAQVRAWVHQNISPRLAGKMDENLLKGLTLAALRKSGRGELSTEATQPSTPDQAVTDVMMARPGRNPPPKSVATTHASVVEKTLDFLNRHFLDSFSQLKKRQLAGVKGQVTDQINAYAREQLMHGRATERLKDLNTDYLAPMIKIAGEAELTREDVSDGLYAIHAPEANAYIATINPALPDGGSGLTNKAASSILASYTPEQRKALSKIDAIVQKMNNAKLDRMVSEGLITPQQRHDMQQRYKHWLSMKQLDDEENFGFSGGGGLSVKGKEFQARMGRFSEAEDPLSMTIRDAMYAVMRAEKNRVARTFHAFVRANPNPSAWEEVTQANYPTQRIIDPQTGQVRTVPDPLALWREPEYFGAKVNGEQKWIRVKDKLLAEQMKKLGDHGLDSDNELVHMVMKAVNGATRILSRFYTQFSPDFALVNPIRDLQHGVLIATSLDKAKGKEIALRMLKNLPAALRDAAVANFQEMQGKHPGGLYEQFRQDGGTTGGFGLDDAKTIQKEMERAMAALNGDVKAKAALGVQAMLKPIMALNDSLENMTRFATYKAALEAKMTREQAAVMAKNVTVNFNKRGQASPVLNALYAFFNASLQANAQVVRGVFRSRIVQVASLGLFAAGAYVALSDDEDERGIDESERVSEFVQDRNFTIPYGDKKAVKIPLAYGFNIPFATGRHLVRVLQGKETAPHMLGAILKLGFTTFLPTDSPVPTVAQPIADVVTGKDFAGRQIAKENPFDAVTPKSSQYKENANAAAVSFFKTLNAATGGSEFTKGAIDVSPEKAAYLIKQYLGGLAVPLELGALPFAEKTTTADIPVARRFVAEAKEDIYVTKAAGIIREGEARRKEIEAGAESKPGEEEYVQTLRAYDSALRRLSAARNRMLKEDKKADVSEVDEQRNLLADQVLTARRAFQREAR